MQTNTLERKVSVNSSPNAGGKFVTIQLPALTPEQSAILLGLGIDPSSVPRFLKERALSPQDEALARSVGVDPYEPQIGPSSVSAPMEHQLKFDAWIAAGGYLNDDFMRFFGIAPEDDTLH